MRDEAAESVRALGEVVERLRAPGGCPWDREQTHRTLRPYLLEETYEALEAIEGGQPARLREELGDILLQVLMHCAIAQESPDGFDVGEVAEVTRQKMVHRHPHVFGTTEVAGAAEVVVNWERLKAAEKGERLSVLEGVPITLPALAYALGVQKRPARLGFDETPEVAAALARLQEALAGLEAETAAAAAPTPQQGADWALDQAGPAPAPPPVPGGHAPPPPPAPPALEAAVGELLWSAVAVARRLRVNPEDALRQRADRFAGRFRDLEARAREEGRSLYSVEAEEWERRWQESGRV
ncbi:MAG TPA: MazG family protein [Candidatus Dormibacteraeota bacterium]|nr:MazG family protein [Candidatus Dormibacteraeota bacterium]